MIGNIAIIDVDYIVKAGTLKGWQTIATAQLPVSPKKERVGALLLDGNVYAPVDILVKNSTATIRHRKSGNSEINGDNYVHGQIVFTIES